LEIALILTVVLHAHPKISRCSFANAYSGTSAAALRGFNTIVPVDGMSGDGQNTYTKQAVAYILTSAPILSPKITLTSKMAR